MRFFLSFTIKSHLHILIDTLISCHARNKFVVNHRFSPAKISQQPTVVNIADMDSKK